MTELSRKSDKTERRNWKRPDWCFYWMRKKSFKWTWWTAWTTWTNLIFSSPFCPLGPQNAGLRQKYAVKYKEQMPPCSFKNREYFNLKICQAAGIFKIKEDKSFCHKPSKRLKKSTDSKIGLPSAALTKDGGGKKWISNNSLTLKMAKDFQVWWWFYFREKFFQILDPAEIFGRLFIFL